MQPRLAERRVPVGGVAEQYSTWHGTILRAMASYDLAEAERREPVGGVDGQYMT